MDPDRADADYVAGSVDAHPARVMPLGVPSHDDSPARPDRGALFNARVMPLGMPSHDDSPARTANKKTGLAGFAPFQRWGVQ